MQILNVVFTLPVWLCLTVSLSASEEYGCHQKDAQVRLRVGTGGAGQSGLLAKLSNEFVKYRTKDCTDGPFKIEWVLGDTTDTINNLKSGKADVGITYNTAAEMLAIENKIATGCKHCGECNSCKTNTTYYGYCGVHGSCDCCEQCQNRPCEAFRDHFYLVGPKENPAGLQQDDRLLAMFSKLYSAAEKSGSTVRFLSRYDKSATNIKDSELWIKIGQVPWGVPSSSWYHRYNQFPIPALEEASRRNEYTITDRGTYLTLKSQNRCLLDRIKVYKSGVDEKELVNPGHIIVGNHARDWDLAWSFFDWINSPQGQTVVANFNKGDGVCLYKPYPIINEVQPTECSFTLEEMSERMDL